MRQADTRSRRCWEAADHLQEVGDCVCQLWNFPSIQVLRWPMYSSYVVNGLLHKSQEMKTNIQYRNKTLKDTHLPSGQPHCKAHPRGPKVQWGWKKKSGIGVECAYRRIAELCMTLEFQNIHLMHIPLRAFPVGIFKLMWKKERIVQLCNERKRRKRKKWKNES